MMKTIQDLATVWGLVPTSSNGQTIYAGKNPLGQGATHDGFLLFEETGMALDRKTGIQYSTAQVAKMAGLRPEEFEPHAQYLAKNGAKPSQKPAPTPTLRPRANPQITSETGKVFDTRSLIERGLLPQTLAHFKITEQRDSELGLQYEYPTFHADGTPGRRRRKWIEPLRQLKKWPEKQPSKYWWLRSKEGWSEPAGYNLQNLLNQRGVVWMVNGEPSVWCCHQNGVMAISPFGEKRQLPKFLETVLAAGVTELHTVPDNDETGYSSAVKLCEIGNAIGVKIHLHHWHKPVGELKAGYDVCDFWEEVGPENFGQKLLELPLGFPPRRERGAAPPSKRLGAARGEGFSERGGNEKTADAQIEKLRELLDALDLHLFNTGDGVAYMTLEKNSKRETTQINSSAWKHLVDEIWDEYGGPTIKKDAMDTLARLLTGRALRQGQTCDVEPRVCGQGIGTNERLYIDLADKSGQFIEVSRGGWRILSDADGVFFRRAPGVLALPRPVRVEADQEWDVWNELRDLLALGGDKNFVLSVGWLLNCLRAPRQPYAALAVSGEQNSGKTEKSKLLRALIDPNVMAVADKPQDARELAIQAKNRFVLGFDNLSGIPHWLGDALCRIVTDGAFSARKLHTDDEEALFSAKRPLLINGIEDFMGRDDFKRRCLFVSIPRVEKRLPVRTIWARFERLAPRVLGLLLNCVSAAIANCEAEEVVSLDAGAGFADLAQWIAGAELGGALPWSFGEFLAAYTESQQSAYEAAMDDLVSQTFARFALALQDEGKTEFLGNSQEIYDAVLPHAAILAVGETLYKDSDETEKAKLMDKGRDILRRRRDWPNTPILLGRDLRRIAQRLRVNDIFDPDFDARTASKRAVRLKVLGNAIRPLTLELDDPFETKNTRAQLYGEN